MSPDAVQEVDHSEKTVWIDLTGDVSAMKISSGVLALACVVAIVGLVLSDGELGNQIAAGIGVVATLLSLAVALAIFRWTRRDSDASRRSIQAFLEQTLVNLPEDEDLESRVGDELEDEELDNEADEQLKVFGSKLKIDGREYRVDYEPGRYDLAWWERLLRRVREVADDDRHRDHDEAVDLLQGNHLRSVVAIAKLDAEQRGNRATLLVTNTNGNGRVWSVFSGKGIHVRDVTPATKT